MGRVLNSALLALSWSVVLGMAALAPAWSQDIRGWGAAPSPPNSVTAPPCATPAELLKLDELLREWNDAYKGAQDAIAAEQAASRDYDAARQRSQLAEVKAEYAEKEVKRAEQALREIQETYDIAVGDPVSHLGVALHALKSHLNIAKRNLADAKDSLERANAALRKALEEVKAADERWQETLQEGASAFRADRAAAKAFEAELQSQFAKKCPPPAAGAVPPPPPGTQEKPPAKPNPPPAGGAAGPGVGPAAANPPPKTPVPQPQPPSASPAPAPKGCESCAKLAAAIADLDAKIDRQQHHIQVLEDSQRANPSPGLQRAVDEEKGKLKALEKQRRDLGEQKKQCPLACLPPGASPPPEGEHASAGPPSSGGAGAVAASVASPLELAVVGEINALRADPGAYASTLPAGPSRRILEMRMPTPALTWDGRIAAAAKAHALDDGRQGTDSHIGSDGSTPLKRLQQQGVWTMISDEVIAIGSSDAKGVVRQLVIDIPGDYKPHLLALIDDKLILVGVSCEANPRYHVLCVIDLAGPELRRTDP